MNETTERKPLAPGDMVRLSGVEMTIVEHLSPEGTAWCTLRETGERTFAFFGNGDWVHVDPDQLALF